MEFHEMAVRGAYRVEINRIEDERGFFARVWCQDEYEALDLHPTWVQANTAFSPRAGTLRGLHYQAQPSAEAKLVRCTRGAVFDVAVDLRPGSDTYLKWAGTELTADNHTMMYVPPGCAHGYLTLADDSEHLYFASDRYAPNLTKGVRYDDPGLEIGWPIPIEVISDRDRSWPLLTLNDNPGSI
jgi:dTDP-4-dehydrorhamnose 3,5-epimerase